MVLTSLLVHWIGRVDSIEQPLSDAEVGQNACSFIAYLLKNTILIDREQCVHFGILPLLANLNIISRLA
ncbi:conserved hypothetical protein [Ricinus communis]|uniref:Uncharacterized protein n=1 Tax=Ricinus communis TaxID=3988 RepID=B9SR59_RICCO|nr:conserved hypothetical protein [Ricinus communis]